MKQLTIDDDSRKMLDHTIKGLNKLSKEQRENHRLYFLVMAYEYWSESRVKNGNPVWSFSTYSGRDFADENARLLVKDLELKWKY